MNNRGGDFFPDLIKDGFLIHAQDMNVIMIDLPSNTFPAMVNKLKLISKHIYDLLKHHC